MSFSSYSFRDRPRLSDRIRGKSGDELFKELRKELDQDRKSFFDSPSSNLGSSAGPTFPRAGHLFEEPLMRGSHHTDIRSHLEDLAQRHPEFADQLRYPAWSNETRTGSWGRKRRGSGDHEASKPQQPPETETAQTEASEEPGPLRGRAKNNLRNTVPDMGQKQQQETEEKESRGQRSWSAPPDNRTQQTEKPRFVSKIEIHPVNPDAAPTSGDATKPPMAPPKPQPQPTPQQQQAPQSHPKSNVRHIPIFVEGRDEPVLPKNIEPEFTQSQAPPQQHFSRPPPQPQFSPPQHHFQPQYEPSPPRYEQPQPQWYEQPQPQPQRCEQPQPTQPKSEPLPPQQTEQTQPETPPVNARDPLYRVGCVQKEIDELKSKVENFSGASRSDKDYILLDELLTRNLIKLDDIETEGKEEVRAARKNTIKSIQRCISVLENKVPLPGNEKKEEEAMEVEQTAATDVASDSQLTAVLVPQPQGSSGESHEPQETNTLGTDQVSSTEEKKEVTSEVNKEALENKEVLDKEVA